MTSQRDIDDIALDLATADRAVKEAEKMKEDLRTEFFFAATAYVKHSRVLAKRAIILPKSFFHTTKLSFEDFVASRYPTWRLVAHETLEDDASFSLLIEEDPEYTPFSVECEATHEIVSRQVAQSSPLIDLDTLKAEAPEVWEKIAKPTIVYVVDTDVLTTLAKDDPSVIALLQRHYHYPRKPSKKLGPIRIAKEEEDENPFSGS